jgi:2-polyprenyl-3-methyl-5-hydroxy-6-metoxy-1,4-benzoquinol methylase
MTEKLSACPICNNADEAFYLEGKDYFLTKEPFQIVECRTCGFRYTNPRPTEESSGKYYQSEDYISHDAGKNGLIPALYGIARYFTLRSKFGIVKRYSPGNSILDIGCGTGEFLNYCQKKGYKCTGVEPSEKARTFAETNYKLDVKTDFLNGLEATSRFDCITLWHVLEHIHQLDKTMMKLTHVLSPGAILIVALPNSNSHDASSYQEFWAAFDLPRHLYHFNRESLIALAKKHQLSCHKILPQKLDSYYISLLSEKYKRGSANYFNAFFHGFLSNIKARVPQIGHSSEIYILKHKIS